MAQGPNRLQNMAERLAVMLISEATQGKLGGAVGVSETPNPIDFKDRRALLDTITKLIREKNSKEPEDPGSFGSLKDLLNDGNEPSGEAERRDDPISSAISSSNGHAATSLPSTENA